MRRPTIQVGMGNGDILFQFPLIRLTLAFYAGLIYNCLYTDRLVTLYHSWVLCWCLFMIESRSPGTSSIPTFLFYHFVVQVSFPPARKATKLLRDRLLELSS